MKTKTALILDMSGSMGSIVEAARTNFNEQLQVLKEESQDADTETNVTVVTFNQDIKEVDFDVDVNTISEITEDEYTPNGMTALYDAIGTTIDKFVEHYDLDDDETGVLFTIITDGMENSSTEYKGEIGRRQLKEKIDKLEKTGKWTFTFMGTIEALDQANGIGITNSMVFDATVSGLADASVAHGISTRSYYDSRKINKVAAIKDFYNKEK